MKQFKIIIFPVFITLILGACSEKEIETESFTIKYGTECGWCAGQEYIIVSNSTIEYKRIIPCGDNVGTINKSMELCSCDWNDITASFNYELFKTLDYTNCNVCADGCDEIIQITEDTFSRELRYSFSDEVEGMENLRNKLSDLMETMRNLD